MLSYEANGLESMAWREWGQRRRVGCEGFTTGKKQMPWYDDKGGFRVSKYDGWLSPHVHDMKDRENNRRKNEAWCMLARSQLPRDLLDGGRRRELENVECRVKRRMQRMAEEAVLWMVKEERVFRGDENINERNEARLDTHAEKYAFRLDPTGTSWL
ncbi:hypothetical protein Naga_100059g23 [Nannochloropsis gaditana]|uniref:Uncharacterized protein n=1 Tax=Nannochloropsis gaditana TaxID=72520 RepID=W7U4J0_9STRA|nr:hypothetical protein Naga_100059g23 [Nannochloropsis gaditana]